VITIKCPGRFWRSSSWDETTRTATCSTCEQPIQLATKGAGLPVHWINITVHSVCPLL
jgi:hypothetical protein